MPNDKGLLLVGSAYRILSTGECVTSGDYRGCVKVSDIHYWLEAQDDAWVVHDVPPDSERMTRMTKATWDKIKAGGDHAWDVEKQCWTAGGVGYRLSKATGGNVGLVKV